ncbi:MAG TPA: hypothetical protein VGB00_16960, partial [Pyrinomonadaceae bacterium]
MQKDSVMEENKQGLILKEKAVEAIPAGGNGNLAPAQTKELPVSKQISNEHLIAEEKSLLAQEQSVEKNYQGWRGYMRLFHVSRVIGMLSLYLYLDQYDLHHAQHEKHAEARMETAKRLTWLAVAGEYFYEIRQFFFHQ